MSLQPPLYEQIYTQLRSDILSGKFAPGELLPAELLISEQYGVSRITTNRALSLLAEQGLVVRLRGKGTFVSNNGVQARLSSDEPALSTAARPLLIGYVVPNIRDTYGIDLFSSIESEINRLGGFLIIERTYGNPTREQEAIRRLAQLGVKGLIIYPVNGEYYNPEILRLSLEGFPISLVDRLLPRLPIPSFTTNNRQAAYLLTQHLIAGGHKKIAFLSHAIDGTVTLEDRHSGYEAALREAGLTPEQELCPDELFSEVKLDNQDHEYMKNCVSMTADFLHRHNDVTGILAAEFNFSMYAYTACTLLERRVPEDVSIATFDGPSFDSTPWHFTHIRQNEKVMGTLAVQCLWKQIHGESIAHISSQIAEGELITGHSTRTLPGYPTTGL